MISGSINIIIRNLRVPTLIGVYKEERSAKQEVILNIELELSRMPVPISDNLCDTVDYALLAKELTSWITCQESYLLEHLAYQSILKIFDFDKRIVRAGIELMKPGCIPNADGAAVKLLYFKDELLKNEYSRTHGRIGL